MCYWKHTILSAFMVQMGEQSTFSIAHRSCFTLSRNASSPLWCYTRVRRGRRFDDEEEEKKMNQELVKVGIHCARVGWHRVFLEVSALFLVSPAFLSLEKCSSGSLLDVEFSAFAASTVSIDMSFSLLSLLPQGQFAINFAQMLPIFL